MTKFSLLAATTSLLSLALLSPSLVLAQETYPRFTGEIVVEVQNAFTFDSDDPTAEINDLFTTSFARHCS